LRRAIALTALASLVPAVGVHKALDATWSSLLLVRPGYSALGSGGGPSGMNGL
jgi:hypothetical protein